MLVLYIFILMFTISINHLNKKIHSIYINRISILTILVSILLSINVLNFQAIGKGISIYSGLFQITVQSQIVEIFLLIIGLCILMSWHNISHVPSLESLTRSKLASSTGERHKDKEANLKIETQTNLEIAQQLSLISASFLDLNKNKNSTTE